MILPQTYFAALILMIFGILCQGSWANTLRLAGPRWRFELYYFDFAVGLMIMASICGLTFGSLGFDGFALMDDFVRSGKRQWLFGFLAGIVFNLANMLLASAISLAGLAVAFPLAGGITLLGTAIWRSRSASMSPLLVIAGCLLILLAIVLDAASYYRLAIQNGPKLKKLTIVKPLLLCLAGGLAGGLVYPLIARARYGESGLGPYGAAVMFCLGMVCSTFVYNLYFMNLPVEGEPLEILDYFQGGLKVHWFGLAGGIVWCAGLIAVFVVAGAPDEAQPGMATGLGISQGGPLVAALWGLFYWKEFSAAAVPTKRMAWLMVVLFACGLALFSMASPAVPKMAG